MIFLHINFDTIHFHKSSICIYKSFFFSKTIFCQILYSFCFSAKPHMTKVICFYLLKFKDFNHCFLLAHFMASDYLSSVQSSRSNLSHQAAITSLRLMSDDKPQVLLWESSGTFARTSCSVVIDSFRVFKISRIKYLAAIL